MGEAHAILITDPLPSKMMFCELNSKHIRFHLSVFNGAHVCLVFAQSSELCYQAMFGFLSSVVLGVSQPLQSRQTTNNQISQGPVTHVAFKDPQLGSFLLLPLDLTLVFL